MVFLSSASPRMGSVLAASAAPAPPLPPGFGLPPLPPPATGSGPQREAKNVLPNPGAFEQCHQKCKGNGSGASEDAALRLEVTGSFSSSEVFPTQVNGVRLVLNKALSKHFQVNHSLQLSSTEDSGYRFGTVFVGSGQAGPAEFYPVLVGDVDSSGSLNAQVIHRVTDRIRSKVVFQTHQQTFVTWKADAEFRGEDFTAAVAFTNPDVLDDSGMVITHYLQSVTPALAMGGQLVYRRRPGDEASFLSLVGRYTGSNFVGALTLGWASVQASYYHRASDKLGVELETGSFLEDSSMTFGYQLDVPEANLQFKGVINSNWVVGATLEKKLLPLPLSLVLCSFLNHQKNKFHCGFGVVIG
ncbi:mitochondrial import receptor subunit TOM40B isoform X2 [Xiphophorus hellerii]|uniref:mitochondrial import receptor subunit TOM40B isoform X2 n=1 Tax=Xiphophorus hellerii TaxID=8084 RepID=UPI0013B3A8A2|nr:mitochondrial import receptor subunit TOM40 homolog isoform X2 [Xiphophorus hellerii]